MTEESSSSTRTGAGFERGSVENNATPKQKSMIQRGRRILARKARPERL